LILDPVSDLTLLPLFYLGKGDSNEFPACYLGLLGRAKKMDRNVLCKLDSTVFNKASLLDINSTIFQIE
jgi:hypothetical protein